MADCELCRCSSGCSTLRQWDLSRAVPRHVRDVALVKGDILGLATAPGRVFTAGADGAIRRDTPVGHAILAAVWFSVC